DAGRVGDRLPARQLELVAAQDERRAAELGHPDLERNPSASRRLLEHERDAAAGQHRLPLGGSPALQLERAVEQRGQLVTGQLLTGQEVAWGRHAGRRYYAWWRSGP